MSLIELVERVEKASGPDRELDCWIEAALPDGRLEPGLSAEQVLFLCEEREARDEHDCCYDFTYADENRVRRFTASLDAAMSLVPEGVGWSIGFGMVPGLGDAPQLFVALQDGPDMRAYAGYATPALALVAAALRARAQQEQTI